MKHPKIAVVAEWDGWCGACATERPLILTRTGRQSLRSWFAGTCDTSRPLTLTCRLCGVGVLVPREEDDPLVPVDDDELVDTVSPALPWQSAVTDVLAVAPVHAPLPAEHAAPVEQRAPALASLADRTPAPELTAARQGVATVLGALLVQRAASVPAAAPPSGPGQVAPVPVLAPALAPALTPLPIPHQAVPAVVPQQRTSAVDGVAELQLLADGIDLLSTGRA